MSIASETQRLENVNILMKLYFEKGMRIDAVGLYATLDETARQYVKRQPYFSSLDRTIDEMMNGQV
jgi:hypothetical protein